MTIRHTLTTSELRFFEDDNPPPMAPYDACAVVVWESERVVWLRLLHGKLSRKLLRQLLDWLHEHGVERVMAHRAPRRLLPLAKPRGDGLFELDVADAVARAASGEGCAA